jgi:hypothetical protein
LIRENLRMRIFALEQDFVGCARRTTMVRFEGNYVADTICNGAQSATHYLLLQNERKVYEQENSF